MGDYIQYYPGAPFCGSTIEEYEKFVADLVDIKTRKTDFILTPTDIQVCRGKTTPEHIEKIFSFMPSFQKTNYKVPDMKLTPEGMNQPKAEIGWFYPTIDSIWNFTFHASPHWFAIYRYLEIHDQVAFQWSDESPDDPHAKYIPCIELVFSDRSKAEIGLSVPIIPKLFSDPSTDVEGILLAAASLINAIDERLHPYLKDDSDVMASSKMFSSKNQNTVFFQKLRRLV